MDDSSEEDERLNTSKIRGERDLLRTLDWTSLENMLPIWDDGRMILEEGHIALKNEMKFAT